MKIDPSDASSSQPSSKSESFDKALAKARPKVPPRRAPLGHPGARATHAHGPGSAYSGRVSVHLQETLKSDVRLHQTLSSARSASDQVSADRTDSRTFGLVTLEHQMKARIAELVARDQGRVPDAVKKELPTPARKDEPRAVETKPATREQPSAPQQTDAAQAAAPVSSVMALVEKVEVFVRSNRPTLSLSLGGELSGQIEIEKVGPGKVALRWMGGARQDAGAPERIRRALADRGLEVTRLQLG